MAAHQLRAEGLVDDRWWSVAELETTTEDIRPEGLAGLVARILEHGAPTEPHLIED